MYYEVSCVFMAMKEYTGTWVFMWMDHSVSCQCDIALFKGGHTFIKITIPTRVGNSVQCQVSIRQHNLYAAIVSITISTAHSRNSSFLGKSTTMLWMLLQVHSQASHVWQLVHSVRSNVVKGQSHWYRLVWRFQFGYINDVCTPIFPAQFGYMNDVYLYMWWPLSLSRLNGDINLNWFVYPADWFVQLVQSSFCYLIWSCQLSSQLLYQGSASHVFFSVVCAPGMFCCLLLDSFVIGAWLNWIFNN